MTHFTKTVLQQAGIAVAPWQTVTALDWQARTSAVVAELEQMPLPVFVKLAEAYGWKGIRIESEDQLDAGIQAMIDHPGPVIVDCRVHNEANCYPMIPSGAAHTDMILQGDVVAGTYRFKKPGDFYMGLPLPGLDGHPQVRDDGAAAGVEIEPVA